MLNENALLIFFGRQESERGGSLRRFCSQHETTVQGRKWYDNYSDFTRIMHFPWPRPARRKRISNLTTTYRTFIHLCLCKKSNTETYLFLSNALYHTDHTSQIRESGKTELYFGINKRSCDRVIYSFWLLSNLFSNFFSEITIPDRQQSANR